jgi:hypothetical protein
LVGYEGHRCESGDTFCHMANGGVEAEGPGAAEGNHPSWQGAQRPKLGDTAEEPEESEAKGLEPGGAEPLVARGIGGIQSPEGDRSEAKSRKARSRADSP